MSNRFKGKVALVTGAGRRLGKATALALARRGAAVAVHYHASEEEAHKVVAEIELFGGRAMAVQADQGDKGQVDSAVGKIVAKLGGIDILINSASVFERTPFLDSNVEAWDRHINTNLRGPYLFCRAVAPGMLDRGAGKIVNLADVEPDRPWPAYLAYSVSKAGLVALTRGLARTLAPRIQVNAVAPGTIRTPRAGTTDMADAAAQEIPLGRRGEPEDIANAALFLLSDLASYITGVTLAVDGGTTIGGRGGDGLPTFVTNPAVRARFGY